MLITRSAFSDYFSEYCEAYELTGLGLCVLTCGRRTSRFLHLSDADIMERCAFVLMLRRRGSWAPISARCAGSKYTVEVNTDVMYSTTSVLPSR